MEDLFSAQQQGLRTPLWMRSAKSRKGFREDELLKDTMLVKTMRTTCREPMVSRARSTVFGLGRSTFTVETLLLKSGQVAMLSSTRPRGFTSGRRGK